MKDKKVQGIIWDLDGVLLDTDLARKRSQTKFLKDCGFDEEEIENIINSWNRLFWYFEEIEYSQILHILQKEFQCEEKLTEEKIIFAQKTFPTTDIEDISITDGVKEILDICVGSKIPMGIVSNGDLDYQLEKMKKTGLDIYFPRKETIVVKDKTTGKPHSDGIIEVCKILDSNPTQTLFIGDRITDTIAAHLAGCIPINYLQYVPDAKEPPQPKILSIENPYKEITSIKEIISFLE